MSAPFGQVLVGLIVLAVAFNQLRIAVKASFMKKDYADADLRGRSRRLVKHVARAGYSARGLVFAVIGSLLIIAALNTNPNEAEGFGGALSTLRQQAYGPWLLAIVAVGLLGYAAPLHHAQRAGPTPHRLTRSAGADRPADPARISASLPAHRLHRPSRHEHAPHPSTRPPPRTRGRLRELPRLPPGVRVRPRRAMRRLR